MYPILVDWGPFFIPTWHLFFVLGALGSYTILLNLTKNCPRQPKLSEREVSLFFLVSYLGAYLGSRIFSSSLDQLSKLENIPYIFSFGPMNLFGGLAGGFLAAGILVLFHKELLNHCFLSKVVISAYFGLGIVRIGCFLNGDDYGKPVPEHLKDAWWSIALPNLGDNIPRYPVQLLEAFLCFLLGLGFYHLGSSKHILAKYTFPAGLMGYAVIRFFLEYLRGDPGRGWIDSLQITYPQCACLILLGISLILFYVKKSPNELSNIST